MSEYEHRLAGTSQERVFVSITNPRWKAQPPWHLFCWSNKREAVGTLFEKLCFPRARNAHCEPSVASPFSTVRWGLQPLLSSSCSLFGTKFSLLLDLPESKPHCAHPPFPPSRFLHFSAAGERSCNAVEDFLCVVAFGWLDAFEMKF